MDLDGDGHRDVLSGSWPGELYVFAGAEDGSFAKATTLTDKDGEPIKLGSASVVYATDWDGDGDVDLIVGNIQGDVHWVSNESGGKELSFGAAVKLEADGAPIRLDHTGPVVADWDGDGRNDLIVGAGNGTVQLYRDTAEKGAPVLAAAVELVGPCEMYAKASKCEPSGCGSRSKVCVADWNGDGRLDLLLGDFTMVAEDAPELTDEQKAEQNALQQKQAEIQPKMMELSKAMQAELKEEFADEEGNIPAEKQEAYAQRYREMLDENEEWKKVQEEYQEVWTKLSAFMPKRTPHGNVWVFLRKAEAPPPEAAR